MPQSYLEAQEIGKQGPNQVEVSEALVLDTNFKGMSKIIKLKKKKQ